VLDSRALLRQAGLFAKKSFGQNFLVAEPVVHAIAEACVPPGERDQAVCVELGAGLGALTSELVGRARQVVAVERDRELVPILGQALEPSVTAGRLRIVEADAQTVDIAALFSEAEQTSSPPVSPAFSVADPRPSSGAQSSSASTGSTGLASPIPRVLCGNLPYQITGSLLQLAVRHASHLTRAVFMVQDEVADRLVASPGAKEYGALTVFVHASFRVRRLLTVSRACFHPSPEVTSAVVVLEALRPPRSEETEAFRAVVKGAFAMRRKTLRNAWKPLSSDPDVLNAMASAAGVGLESRGETLDVEAFAAAAEALIRSGWTPKA
jgi:16S rRNA (adenine1518-N6/adenine1519-N6)-dimethyltransferase